MVAAVAAFPAAGSAAAPTAAVAPAGDRARVVVPSSRNTSSCLVIMDPKHSAEVSKHLDKQNQALMETYRSMSHELHKLQVEEETIMRKLYGLMSAEGLLPKSAQQTLEISPELGHMAYILYMVEA